MTMITVERLATAKGVVEKLTEQAHLLYGDIAETAQDRARLLQEAEHRESMVNDLDAEIRELREHVRELENRNRRLTDEGTALESKLADATARLESISATARIGSGGEFDIPPPRNGDGPNEAAAKAGLAALERLTAVGVNKQ